ncbi:hypothetical protein V6N13_043064 [Hibiscus sabdariffa]
MEGSSSSKQKQPEPGLRLPGDKLQQTERWRQPKQSRRKKKRRKEQKVKGKENETDMVEEETKGKGRPAVGTEVVVGLQMAERKTRGFLEIKGAQ